jgi:WD40 repeat protein
MSEAEPRTGVDREHPWPALLSFREDDQRYFGGREEEVEALYRRIAASRLTLLFGLSGLGKTSLLRAGLFPRLRGEHYFPVYVRLGYGRDLPSPVEQIKAEIVAQARASGVEAPPPRRDETLWQYFHRPDADFWDERNYPCTPVLVFDQFEELFTKSREVAAGANDLIEELANLAEAASPALQYRLLIGIRSDYLAQLQSISDRVRAVFANRYELHRMSGTAALESTLTAGGHLMDEEVARHVVRFVAGAKEGGGDGSVAALEVEPALLSLMCSELNATRIRDQEPKITVSMLSGSKGEILSRFYETSFADVAPALRELVEDKLVTRDGAARNFISEQTASETPGVTEKDLAKLVERRLLRFEESGSSRRMELTHDLLTTVAAASRSTREQRRQIADAESARAEAEKRETSARRALRRSRFLVLVFLVLLAAAVAGPFVAARWTAIGAKKVEADAAFRLALQKLSSEEPNEGLAYLARVIRLDRGSPAVRTLLYQQLLTRAWPVPVRRFGPEGHIDKMMFSDDGARIAFLVGPTIEMWDVARGQRLGSWDTGFETSLGSIRLASDGWTVMIALVSPARNETRRAMWDPRTGEPRTVGDLAKLPGLDRCFSLQLLDRSAAGGDLLVDCGGGGGLIVYSLRTNEVEAELGEGHLEGRFGPDPRFIRVGLDPETVVDRRQPSSPILAPPLDPADLVGGFGRDGKRVVVGRVDGDVEVWDLESRRVETRFHNQSRARTAVFDPSGRRIVTTAVDDGIRVWSVEDGTMDFDPLWHADVRVADFSQDGRRIFTASDGVARWWSAENGSALGMPVVQRMLAAHLDPRGDIVTVSPAVRAWRLAPAVLPRVLEGDGEVLGFSSDRRTVVARIAGMLAGFDTASGKQRWTLPAGKDPIAIDNTGTRMIALRPNGQATVDEVATGRTLWRIDLRVVLAPILSPDGSAVVLVSSSSIDVRAAATGRVLASIAEPGTQFQGMSGDGSVLLLRSNEAVRVWDVHQRRAVLTMPDEDDLRLTLSPDGRRLAAVSPRQGLRMWDVGSNKVRTVERKEGEDDFDRAVFSLDGTRLAVTSQNAVTICDAETLACAEDELAHPWVEGVELSADGARILTVNAEELRVWDVATKRPLSLALPRDERSPAALSPDGTTLFAVSHGALYRLPLPVFDDDDAERLADLGEAIAGVSVDRLGVTKSVDGLQSLADLAARCKGVAGSACDLVRAKVAIGEARRQ